MLPRLRQAREWNYGERWDLFSDLQLAAAVRFELPLVILDRRVEGDAAAAVRQICYVFGWRELTGTRRGLLQLHRNGGVAPFSTMYTSDFLNLLPKINLRVAIAELSLSHFSAWLSSDQVAAPASCRDAHAGLITPLPRPCSIPSNARASPSQSRQLWWSVEDEHISAKRDLDAIQAHDTSSCDSPIACTSPDVILALHATHHSPLTTHGLPPADCRSRHSPIAESWRVVQSSTAEPICHRCTDRVICVIVSLMTRAMVAEMN